MATLGDAYINIIPKAPGISQNIEGILSGGPAASAAQNAGVSLGRQLLGGLAKLGIGAAAGKMLKDALGAGGDLQQSFGGLETIYGEAAAGAKAYAEEAARAGISMNSYAEQAVSFGAALKQAYAGDTVAAMEAANLAILDMADNAAKMGTDLTSIQNAYQGFAKQNYTMLDNLKLGYGGTKEEMQRLLADAEKLTGVHYDINNLGDVYSAIHAIQTDLGLTGVAAQEAETTLTGSAGAMKASWQNFLASLTTGEGMDESLGNLGETTKHFAENLLSMLGTMGEQVPELLRGLFDTVAENFSTLPGELVSLLSSGLANNLQPLIESGINMLGAVISGIIDNLPELTVAAVGLVGDIASAIIGALPELTENGGKIVNSLLSGIAAMVPALVVAGGELIRKLIAAIAGCLGDLYASGGDVLGNVLGGIVEAVPYLLESIIFIPYEIIRIFTEQDWAGIGKNIIDGIVNGVTNFADRLHESVTNLSRNAFNRITSFFRISSPSKLMADEVGKWIPAGIALGIDENSGALDSSVAAMGRGMVSELRRYTAPGNLNTGGSLDGLADRLSERPVTVVTRVSLEGDARKIFRVVRAENDVMTRMTGANVLAGGFA